MEEVGWWFWSWDGDSGLKRDHWGLCPKDWGRWGWGWLELCSRGWGLPGLLSHGAMPQ